MGFRNLINSFLKFTKYRVVKVKPELNRRYNAHLDMGLDFILAHQFLKSKDFFFVQIGANDGIRADDIHQFVKQHQLAGLVIEPLNDLFKALVENYKDCPNVTPVNAAIDRTDQSRILYRVDPHFTSAPDWCQGIASFNKAHVLSAGQKIPGIEENIIEERVRCISFDTLIAEYGVEKIDLLQIDTEGYDYEIIKMVDFQTLAPGMIRYEDAGLSKKEADECLSFLIERGYKIFSERNDIVAIKV